MTITARYQPMMKEIAALYAEHADVCTHIEAARVTGEEWDLNRGGGHLRFEVPSSAPRLDPLEWDTIDAHASDEDGTPIVIIFHLGNARIDWGEWFRVDGEAIIRWPPTTVRRGPFE